jgi:hypothetical protein
VAKAAMPAVVNISSTRTVRGPSAMPGPFLSDPFFRFFGGPELGPLRERSLGSGVLFTADGIVITNSHVVEGAQDIKVTLADRREMTGRLIGADPETDLAIVKLPGKGFPVLAFGDSSRVDLAEVVLAVGNPFGLSQTVTMGIVSALGRANLGIADYEDFIQTDAAINPGNSGGALVNARGQLIGINTAIFSQSGGYQGIGFAVPVYMARQVMEQFVSRGAVTRGYLGVAVRRSRPPSRAAWGPRGARHPGQRRGARRAGREGRTAARRRDNGGGRQAGQRRRPLPQSNRGPARVDQAQAHHPARRTRARGGGHGRRAVRAWPGGPVEEPAGSSGRRRGGRDAGGGTQWRGGRTSEDSRPGWRWRRCCADGKTTRGPWRDQYAPW